MSNDERPESLAAQAAAWVPPWERPRSEPDRAYQAAHRAADDAGDQDDVGDRDDEGRDGAEGRDDADGRDGAEGRDDADGRDGVDGRDGADGRDDAGGRDGEAGAPDDDEDRSAAGLSDDDDDFDPSFEGGNPTGYGIAEPGDDEAGRAVVDEPRELSGDDEAEPTDVRLGGEVPLPESVEEAAEAGEDEGGAPVDAPLPSDGDDAGDVFDAAADDDVDDDGDVDLPFVEVVPAGDGDGDDDEAFEADEAEFRRPVDAERDAAELGEDDFAGLGDDVRGSAELGGEAAAYVAGAADAAAALGGRRAVDDALPSAEPTTPPVAADGLGVPMQGRRRRDDVDAFGDDGRRTSEAEDDAESVSSMPALEDDAELAAALEAIMLVVDEPVAEMQLAQILEQPTERIATALDDLSARYTAAGHGFDLRRAAGGWRLYTRPEYAAYVERFVLDGQSVRLTQAALETLAVVAYKQPVTRSRISAIRGVNCDGVMRTLATRGLIEECGTEGETGAHLYRTTALFLEKLGLNSVEQLPPLAPFLPDDVEEVLDATG